jgi:hypothetical protein
LADETLAPVEAERAVVTDLADATLAPAAADRAVV